MTMHVRPFLRAGGWELPSSLDGLVPADHPVRFVAAYIDSLTPTEWEMLGIAWQEGGLGSHGYHPVILLGAWLWGFMSGTRSSRRLEAACQDQLAMLWLTGGQQPDHKTLWRFYQGHRAGMRYLLTDTVRLAVRMQLVDLAVAAVDGTKVSGNAARDRSYTSAGLERLLERTEQAIADLEAQNATDDAPPPPRLPKDLASTKALAERIRTAQAELAELGDRSRINLTDADARLMPSRHGFVVGYNCQGVVSPLTTAAAETPSGMLITAAEVTTDPADQGHLVPMLQDAAGATGQHAEHGLADAGYASCATLTACSEAGIGIVMPADSAGPGAITIDHPYHRSRFVHDEATDTYQCPEGQTLTFSGLHERSGHTTTRRYAAGRQTCLACPAFGRCTKDRHKGRVIEVPVEDAIVTTHRAWMQTEQAKTLYGRRKELVEPVFGIIKEQQGLRRFLLRSRTNVTSEWKLLATAFNLRTLARLWQRYPALLTRPIGS